MILCPSPRGHHGDGTARTVEETQVKSLCVCRCLKTVTNDVFFLPAALAWNSCPPPAPTPFSGAARERERGPGSRRQISRVFWASDPRRLANLFVFTQTARVVTPTAATERRRKQEVVAGVM